MSKSRVFICGFMIFAAATAPLGGVHAASQSAEPIHTKPLNVPARPNAEYYSASPDSTLVMPVNIWGNVREPGLHFVPIGSSLNHSVSVAGGPTDRADMGSIRILRGGKLTYADLMGPKSIPLQANDYVYVEQNYRADLPLIFSGISTILSIVTLYYVMNPRK